MPDAGAPGWPMRWPWRRGARRTSASAPAAHVLANFTVEAMQRRTLAVYDRLLGTVLERRFAGNTEHSILVRNRRANLDLRPISPNSLTLPDRRPVAGTVCGRLLTQQPMETATYVVQ